jgi:4-amino-4-deoxy-L-arabinose transferase-like glycosyltransferase
MFVPVPFWRVSARASARIATAGWHAAALLLMLAWTLPGIGHPIQNLNEGLYARIAQEMLESGNWTIPSLNGVPYLEKPPLMYWLGSAAYALFGVHDWSARSPALLGVLLMLSAAYWFAYRRAGPRAALCALAILASAPIVLLLDRILLFDALFAGLFAWSLFLLFQAQLEPSRRTWIRLSYASLALAVLAKGLAALVFFGATGAVLLLDALRHRDTARLRILVDPPAVLIFLAIALPWHLAAALREPQFPWFYFVNEHAMRFLGRRVPLDYHSGPWWYYLPRLAAHSLPWLLVLLFPAALPGAAAGRALRRFLLAWVLGPLAFFSLSEAKGDYYMIIAMPALALIIALRLPQLREPRLLAALPLCWLLPLLALPFADAASILPYRLPVETPGLLAITGALALASAWAFLARRLLTGILLLSAAPLPAALLFSAFMAVNEPMKSAQSLAREIRERALQPVFSYKDYEQISALPYYLDAPIGVIASESKDLWWGQRIRPVPAQFPSEEDLRGLRLDRAAVIVASNRLAQFHGSGLAARFALEGVAGKFFLFVSRPPGGEAPD